MKLLTIDFETYYDKAYSLSKLTTEEYVRDLRFETIGVAVKVDDAETEWASGTHEQISKWLQQFPWADSIALAHNAMFDGAILNWRYGIKPKFWLDTLCMGRALHGVEVSGSLAALAERYGVGEKGTDVQNALGKHRADFSAEELSRYGDYCVNDVDLTYSICSTMLRGGFPKKELKLIDLTLRMFTEPVLELDLMLLEQHLLEVQDRKEALIKACGLDNTELLMSNPKFAELLQSFGVQPPVKTSLTTGKETWAFAKSDEGFKALAEYPDERVQALVAARLGSKSTLEETRTERFISIAKRGQMPVPLKYYAAHTGRWGGSDNLNLQNLPSRGANRGKLKSAIMAPAGHVIIDCDSAQIEARVLAWFAGQDDMVEVFKNNNAEILAGVDKKDFNYDPYKLMAARIYSKLTNEINESERFIGKTTILGCFGADTRVLTSTGWKCIVDVLATDMVWDGEEWVTHSGVIARGEKEVIPAYGVNATPDHEILTEHGWQAWSEVATNPSLFQSALLRARLPLPIGSNTITNGVSLLGGIPLCDALAAGKVSWIGITSSKSGPRDVTRAQKLRPIKNGIGYTKIFYRMKDIALDYLTGLQAVLTDAITLSPNLTPTTGGGASLFGQRGAMIGQRSCSTSYHYRDGKTLETNLTESITMKVTCPEISGSYHAGATYKIVGQSRPSKKKLMTYDIAYSGPRNRYTIATDAGPLIVHNCGYGMGAPKFQDQLKAMGTQVELDECRRIVSTYRETNAAVVNLWKQGQLVLTALSQGSITEFGREGVISLVPEELAIRLPSGLLLRYEGLTAEQEEKGLQYSYRTRKGRISTGGKCVENVVQALARIIVGEQMIHIAKRYKPVLTVHDAVACIAPEAEAEEARAYVESCMRIVPEWATGLPVNCESGIGRSYGDC